MEIGQLRHFLGDVVGWGESKNSLYPILAALRGVPGLPNRSVACNHPARKKLDTWGMGENAPEP